jgi:hypothetical protein
LEHRTSMKCFISLLFLNLRQLVGLRGWGISLFEGHYLRRTTQTQNNHRQTYISGVWFEPTIPAFEWAKTLHALDCASIVIGSIFILLDFKIFFLPTSTFVCRHFHSTSINNAEHLLFVLSIIIISWVVFRSDHSGFVWGVIWQEVLEKSCWIRYRISQKPSVSSYVLAESIWIRVKA